MLRLESPLVLVEEIKRKVKVPVTNSESRMLGLKLSHLLIPKPEGLQL